MISQRQCGSAAHGFVVAFLFCSVQADAKSTPISLARSRPLAPVYINGRGPFTFLIDTGATKTLIDQQLAASLELAVLGQTTLRSPTAVVKAPLVRVDELTLAGYKGLLVALVSDLSSLRKLDGEILGIAGYKGLLVALVSDLSSLRKLDGEILGILGFDFLSRYRFLIDYEERRITLRDRRSPWPVEGGTRVAVRVEGSRVLIPVSGGERGSSVWLALDTGAARLVLYAVPQARSLGVDRDIYRSRKLGSTGGTRIVTEARVRKLRVGTLTVGEVPVTLLSESMGAHDEAGLLPGRLFRSVFVDPVGQYVVLNGSIPRATERTSP